MSYNNQPSEASTGFTMFQNKYLMKRKVLNSIVYAIAGALGVNLIVSNPAGIIGYVLTALCLGMIAIVWISPLFKLKKMLAIWQELDEETYIASFFDDRIEIETDVAAKKDLPTEVVSISKIGVTPVEEGSLQEKDMLSEQQPVQIEEKIETSVLKFDQNTIDVKITDTLIIIFLNRSYIYIIPKRCISNQDAEAIAKYFADKDLL